MKALVQLSLIVEVESEDEAAAIALGMRQAAWLAATDKLAEVLADGRQLDDLVTYFEPSVAFPMSLAAK